MEKQMDNGMERRAIWRFIGKKGFRKLGASLVDPNPLRQSL